MAAVRADRFKVHEMLVTSVSGTGNGEPAIVSEPTLGLTPDEGSGPLTVAPTGFCADFCLHHLGPISHLGNHIGIWTPGRLVQRIQRIFCLEMFILDIFVVAVDLTCNKQSG